MMKGLIQNHGKVQIKESADAVGDTWEKKIGKAIKRSVNSSRKLGPEMNLSFKKGK